MAKLKTGANEAPKTENVVNNDQTNGQPQNGTDTQTGTEQDATNDEPEPEPAKPTSPKLVEILAERETINAAILAAKPLSKEWRELVMSLQDNETAETTEIAEIGKQEKARAAKEAENKRVAMFDEAVSAKLASLEFDNSVRGNDGLIPAEHHDKSNELNKIFADKREAVVNELLKSVPRGTPSKSVATGGTSGKRGGITAEIRELIAPMFTEGKSGSDVRAFIIKEKGYNDGTANAVIRAYELENGLK